jgi:hypothetical protein
MTDLFSQEAYRFAWVFVAQQDLVLSNRLRKHVELELVLLFNVHKVCTTSLCQRTVCSRNGFAHQRGRQRHASGA